MGIAPRPTLCVAEPQFCPSDMETTELTSGVLRRVNEIIRVKNWAQGERSSELAARILSGGTKCPAPNRVRDVSLGSFSSRGSQTAAPAAACCRRVIHGSSSSGVKFCRESCLWKMVVPLTAHARATFSHVFPPSILFKPKNTSVVSPGSSVCSSVSRLLSGFQFESPKILERICFFGTEFCLFLYHQQSAA